MQLEPLEWKNGKKNIEGSFLEYAESFLKSLWDPQKNAESFHQEITHIITTKNSFLHQILQIFRQIFSKMQRKPRDSIVDKNIEWSFS